LSNAASGVVLMAPLSATSSGDLRRASVSAY